MSDSSQPQNQQPATPPAKIDWLGVIIAMFKASPKLMTLIVSVLGLSLGGTYLYKSEWINHLVPPPAKAQEVSIRVYGPSAVVRGDRVVFVAFVDGSNGVPKWELLPKGSGDFKVLEEGRVVELIMIEEGDFSFHVAVAGDAQQVASDHVEFEVLEIVDKNQPPPVVHDVPPVEPKPHIPTVAELASSNLSLVESDNLAAEAKIVAGCFNSVIGRVQTGLLNPSADVILEVEDQVNAALGDKAHGWQTYLAAMRVIVESLRDQGQITTAASTVPTLSEMSGVLLKVR